MRSIVLALLFALLAPAAFAQSAGYRIQPGDSLAVTVLEDETLNRQVLVLPDGSVQVPLAGSVQAAGRNGRRRSRAPSPTGSPPTSRCARASSSRWSASPRSSSTPSRSTCSARSAPRASSRSSRAPRSCRRSRSRGGLAPFAAAKRIQLRRSDPSTGQERLYLFNYRAVERGGSIESMITLREGDVILVPERRLFE